MTQKFASVDVNVIFLFVPVHFAKFHVSKLGGGGGSIKTTSPIHDRKHNYAG